MTGAFLAVMIFLMISTDTTYLHSWGSIVIQDVVVPFRKQPLGPERQLLLLRLAITGVAVYAFIFSMFFAQINYILMFFALTGSVYMGGAGSVIIGGLYWKKGTAAGAWAAMSVGAGLAVFTFIGQHTWVDHIYPILVDRPGLMQAVDTVLINSSKLLP